MEGDFIWPRVLHPRAYMAVPWPDMTRFARHVSPHWVFVFFPPPVGLGRGAQPKTDQGERLSEAIAEFELDPVFGEHRRLPRSAAQGTQTIGSPFLCLLSFGDAKESELPPGNPRLVRRPPPFESKEGFNRLSQNKPKNLKRTACSANCFSSL